MYQLKEHLISAQVPSSSWNFASKSLACFSFLGIRVGVFHVRVNKGLIKLHQCCSISVAI